MHSFCPGQRDGGLIGIIGRIENDDFIAGSCERDDGAEQRLRRAARNRDLGLPADKTLLPKRSATPTAIASRSPVTPAIGAY